MTHTDFIRAIVSRVEAGSRFTVNLARRTLRVDGKPVDLSQVEVPPMLEADILSDIKVWYAVYKHSVPSERSESHRRTYFKALPERALSDDDMLYGESRETARCRLELYVLLMLRSGQLRWNDEWGSWFWQSPDDRDLVILREWIEPLAIEKQ